MTLSLDGIVDCLAAHRQRATYGAVADLLGRPPAFVMAGCRRDPLHSWVVNRATLLPTGFLPAQIAPDLEANANVLRNAADLRAWLTLCHNDEDVAVWSVREAEQDDSWWHSLTTRELLQGYDGVMRELRRRSVVRSSNNPVADLAEQFGSAAFHLHLAGKSAKGHDGVAPDGTRWQIKGRRRTPENGSTQLGALRNLESRQFDYLLAVYFDQSFEVAAAYSMDFATVQKHAKFRASLNGHVLRLTKQLRDDPGCIDVTSAVRKAASRCHDRSFVQVGDMIAESAGASANRSAT